MMPRVQERMILMVEDNPDDEALALRAFQKTRRKCRIIVARDGVETLDWLFATGSHAGRDLNLWPRLVLLDLKLPKIDGLEVLRRIRNDPRTRLLPVVVVSASNEEGDILRAYESGANGYIRKPVDFVDFTQAMERMVSYWLDLNLPPVG